MSELFAISRIAKYKYGDCGGVLKEALRTLPNYDNPDCKPELSYLNYSIVKYESELSPEKYIIKYRDEHDISGRFNLNTTNAKNATNVMCQALFSGSPELFSDMSRNDVISYYLRCFDFFKNEFPDVPILSAVVHFDETTPHMHVTFLPIVERKNKKTGTYEKIFSTTLLMPGKDFFQKYQDRFFSYMNSEYDGLSRKNQDDITRDNLTVKEYKKFQTLLEPYKKIIYDQKLEISKLVKEKQVLEDKYNRLRRLENIPFINYLSGVFFSSSLNDKLSSIRSLIFELEHERDLIEEELEKQITGKKVSLDQQIANGSLRKTTSLASNDRFECSLN